MQNLLDKLDGIRRQPANVRRRITFVISLLTVITVGVIFLPFSIKESRVAENEKKSVSEEVPDISSVEDLRAEVNKIGEVINTLKEFKTETGI